MYTPTPTQQLIGFICDQKLDLEQYHSLIPLLQEHFYCFSKFDDEEEPMFDATERLIKRVIEWEKGNQSYSLEKTIDIGFKITIKKPLQKKAPVVNLPEKDLARIRKETTHAAGVIDREMKRLQKMFPEHYFELSFEFQRLGKQKFYRIHIKTLKDG